MIREHKLVLIYIEGDFLLVIPYKIERPYLMSFLKLFESE